MKKLKKVKDKKLKVVKKVSVKKQDKNEVVWGEIRKIIHDLSQIISDVDLMKKSHHSLDQRLAYVESNAASSQSISDEMNRLKEAVLERFIRIEAVLKDKDKSGASRYGLR
jgi:hypothetical protein